MDMHKIAFIGDEPSCLPFASIGIEVFPVTENDAKEKFREIVNSSEYDIIFISEPLYTLLENEIKKIAKNPLPSVVLLPALSGSIGLAMTILRETMKKAAGVDLMSEK